ncbi:MAG: Holliday junction resolvase RuvX [Candidatus Omnitrophica bacterium]|nr:Holliday junction resolvase RuvX [Candidatus Omnitrophota bacterium]
MDLEQDVNAMRILGLDVGDRRVGIALSDALGLTAQRLRVLERTGAASDVAAVEALVAEHQVARVIVGLPLTMAGAQGPQAKKVLAFAQQLRRRLSVPVDCVDERLTTVQGERALIETGASRRKRKQVIDQVAAQLILQHYLDAQRNRTN